MNPTKLEVTLVRKNEIILAFLEDLGAANFLGPILDRMAKSLDDIRLFAEGAGAKQLESIGVPYKNSAEMGTANSALRREAPSAVIVGTSENLDTVAFDLIAAARIAGVPSIGGVDSAANADYRFRGHSDDPLAHAPDALLLTDDLALQNFTTLGFPAERMVVCGHPYYDSVREESRELEKLGQKTLRSRHFPNAGSRSVFMFLGEISDGLNSQQFQKSGEYTLTGRGQSSGRTEIIIEEFLDAVATLEERPYLVLRPHPKNKDSELGPYYREFDMISRTDRSLEIAFAADLIVGMSTSLLVEASIMGRPTVSIVPRPQERDWLPTTAAGITPCVTSRDAIASTLVQTLKCGGVCDFEGVMPFGATKRALAALEQFRSRLNGTNFCREFKST